MNKIIVQETLNKSRVSRGIDAVRLAVSVQRMALSTRYAMRYSDAFCAHLRACRIASEIIADGRSSHANKSEAGRLRSESMAVGWW